MLLTLLIAFGFTSSTESRMDCNSKLIVLGDAKYEVQLKCGPATATDRRLEQSQRSGLLVTVDEWTYDRGPLAFVRTLRFENGKLVRIDVGDYGH